MKKLLFFIIALFASAVGFSQASSLVVENMTNCTQYYIVIGDEICVCGTQYTSSLFSIPAGGIQAHTSTMGLGGSYPSTIPKGIIGARIPDGPVVCQPSGSTVGEPACGLPPIYTYMAIDQSCRPCARTNARWIRSLNCDTSARLVFTP